jgi:hypothetical protein
MHADNPSSQSQNYLIEDYINNSWIQPEEAESSVYESTEGGNSQERRKNIQLPYCLLAAISE